MIRFHAWLATTYLLAVAVTYSAVAHRTGAYCAAAAVCVVTLEAACRAWDRA